MSRYHSTFIPNGYLCEAVVGAAHKKKNQPFEASSLICNVSGGLRFKFVDKRLVDDDLHGAVQNAKLYGCAAMKLTINLEVYLGR